MPFKFLPEAATADLALEVRTQTLEALFKTAALAVEEAMVNTKNVAPIVEKEIILERSSIEELLFDFLQELIFYKDSESLFFSQFEVKIEKNKFYKLKSKIKGEELNYAKHELRDDVKAVTMHQFQVKKNKEWFLKAILDI